MSRKKLKKYIIMFSGTLEVMDTEPVTHFIQFKY